MLSLSLLPFAALAVSPAVQALTLPFTVSRSSKADSDDSFGFDNNFNSSSGADIYVATIQVAGKDYQVQVDTGSSDLWLDTTGSDLSSLTNTGITSGLSYGDGTVAQGNVYVGDITFGDFTFDQAFIAAPGTNATTNGDKGLMGVGPPGLSAISQSLDSTNFDGSTVLGNIFASNSSVSQYITFALSRSFDTGLTDGGVFTVGEVNSTYSAVSNSPKLDVISTDRWIVFMDGMIVNGQNKTGGSSFDVNGQGSGQTVANIDSGTTLGQIPSSYLDFIYKSIPGASFLKEDGLYVVPCDTEIQMSFVFGGIEIPIHPIDATVATPDGQGGVICTSGFTSGDGDTDEDFLLGDSFMRNAYVLFDFGSFFNGTDSPFLQMLPITDKNQASSEFQSLSQSRNNSIIKGDSSGSSGSGSGSGSSSDARPLSTPFANAVVAVAALSVGLLTFL